MDVHKHDGSSYVFVEELYHSGEIINSLDVSDDGMYMAYAPINTKI